MRISDWSSDVCSSDLYPQDEHERMLEARLAERGVTVERETEATAFSQTADGVVAIVGGEPCQADYIAGCDGAHSMVREQRSEERRGGNEWFSTCRSRWSAYHYKKKEKRNQKKN